ncbi:MAG: hypothetical protein WBN03_02090, partial [Desulfobacterales bacterium]
EVSNLANFGRKGKIKYTNEPIGKIKLVEDFLPSPEELVLKDETIKAYPGWKVDGECGCRQSGICD